MAAQSTPEPVDVTASTPNKSAAPRKEKKDESFFEKIGTLGRRKNIKEVQELTIEGQTAISTGPPVGQSLDLPPSEFILEENEERYMVEPKSQADPKVKELIQLLTNWVNDEVAEHRIIVKNIEQDLYDGQILGKLIEKLAGINLQLPEVTQSKETQQSNLNTVLEAINEALNVHQWPQEKWSVNKIHSLTVGQSLVATLHLLIALARHYHAPLRLPDNVVIYMVVVQKREGLLHSRQIREEMTGSYDPAGGPSERDGIDTLVEFAPESLIDVKEKLIHFANTHLNKINLDVTDLDKKFHDGVYLVMLIGLLEGYFVPLYHYHVTPATFDEKLHNVSVAFELMQDAGLSIVKARPEDIVNGDLKCTIRVLYTLVAKYGVPPKSE